MQTQISKRAADHIYMVLMHGEKLRVVVNCINFKGNLQSAFATILVGNYSI